MKTWSRLSWGIFLVSAVTCAAVFAQEPNKTRGEGTGVSRESEATAQILTGNYSARDLQNVVTVENGLMSHLHPESIQLAQKYVKTESEEDKRAIRKKLQEALTKEFDQNIKQQEKELQAVEKQVVQMKSLAEKRVAEKNRIVDRHIEQLADEVKGLGWAGSRGGALLAQDLTANAADLQAWSGNGQRILSYPNAAPTTRKLAEEYANAKGEDEKSEARKKLTDLLGRQFDEHIKRQQKELKELEKQIMTLRSLIKKRVDAKSSIVDRRIDQLLLDAEGLGWGTPGHVNFLHQGVYYPTSRVTDVLAPAKQ